MTTSYKLGFMCRSHRWNCIEKHFDLIQLSTTYEDFDLEAKLNPFWITPPHWKLLDHQKFDFSFRVSEDKFPSLSQSQSIMLYLDLYL